MSLKLAAFGSDPFYLLWQSCLPLSFPDEILS